MADVTAQVHHRFKVFTGDAGVDGGVAFDRFRGRAVRLTARSLGKVDGLEDLGGLEARMGDEDEFVMVFMARA
jgi:hypothetical protein